VNHRSSSAIVKTIFASTILIQASQVYKTIKKMNEIRPHYTKSIEFSQQDIFFEGEFVKDEKYLVGFSNVCLDYTGALVGEEGFIIDIYAEYSNMRIFIPKTWRIALDGSAKRANVIVENIEGHVPEKTAPLVKIFCEAKNTSIIIEKI